MEDAQYFVLKYENGEKLGKAWPGSSLAKSGVLDKPPYRRLSHEEWESMQKGYKTHGDALHAEVVAQVIARLNAGAILGINLLDGGHPRYRQGFACALSGVTSLMSRGGDEGDFFFPGFLAGKEVYAWAFRNGFVKRSRR